MPLQIGVTLNQRYHIVSMLSRGGMGAVYRAWDNNLRIPCAVKENLIVAAESQTQFTREAQMLAQLSHPNLPRVIDHFLIPSQGQYLVMDYIDGQDLQQILNQRGHFTQVEILPYIEQVCDALTYLHTQRPPIIHRDIKPANIRITPQGRAVLVDFGIAKQISNQGQTTRGARAVTPGYSPPEQYGQGTTARSDIYALGATLYALLTGTKPVESVNRMTGETLVHPARASAQVATAILTAMSIDPVKRYDSAEKFKRSLSNPPLKETVVLRTPIVSPAPHNSNKFWIGIVGLAIFFVTGGGIILWNSGRFNETVTVPATPTQIVQVVTQIVTNTPSRDTPSVEPSTPTPTPIEDTPRPTNTALVALPPTVEKEYRIREIGFSAENTPLELHQFGAGQNAVLIIGGIHHGFAPISTSLAERAIAHYARQTDTIPDDTTLYILPNLNPDSDRVAGETRGRLNGNGVDLNRNWGCNWRKESTYENSDDKVSGGTKAFSEPETRAIRNFINDVQLRAVLVYSAKAPEGLVYESLCEGRQGGSSQLATLYRAASDYGEPKRLVMGKGEIGDWLASENIPAIFVMLKDHEGFSESQWSVHFRAIETILAQYGGNSP